MINERLKKRLKKNRPSTTITMRIPTDVVVSLKAVAPMRGFTAYQTLLKSYISEGLRRDEAQFDLQTARRLTEALKRRGVAERVLEEALAEISHATWELIALNRGVVTAHFNYRDWATIAGRSGKRASPAQPVPKVKMGEKSSDPQNGHKETMIRIVLRLAARVGVALAAQTAKSFSRRATEATADFKVDGDGLRAGSAQTG
jgi:hypothetical protein